MTTLTRQTFPLLRLVFSFLALTALLGLAGCGGGGTGGTGQTSPSGNAPLVISPPSATVFSNLPVIISVTGGAAPFQLFSDNPAVIPASGTTSANGNFLIQANNVGATTTVTLTVRDAANRTAAALITVQPATLLNNLSITPTVAAPGQGCTPAVCSGGDALATITVKSVTGALLLGQQVKFEVVQGDYTIQTGNVAQPSVSTLTVTSDQNGVASVRLLAKTNAPTQVALIRATDLVTGDQVTASFTIAQFTNGATILSVLPTDATITGSDTATCSNGVSATYFIFGGTPPYRVVAAFPNTVTITGAPVTTNGGGFTVTSNGSCVIPLNIIITDATGRTVSVTFNNKVGTAAPAAPAPPPLVISPSSLTVAPTSCTNGQADGGSGQAIVTGGSGNNVVASSDATHLLATVGGTPSVVTATLQNKPAPGATFTVTVSDGTRSATLGVTVGPCPVGTALGISPSSAALACGATTNQFTISGGTAPYQVVTPVPTGFTATISGNTLNVTKGTGANNTSATISVKDTAGATAGVAITGSGSPATCP